jgi:hypothetical protein
MKKLIFAIFLACLALSSAQAGKSHGDGAKAVSKGQWATAVQIFTKGCYSENDTASCKDLGEIYEYGRGGATDQRVKKDAALSKQAYERYCEKSKGLRKDCCRKVGK